MSPGRSVSIFGRSKRRKENRMVYVLTVIHVLVCFFLVVVVLLQSGKAADLAGAFGGMGSQTAFGPRGSATVLSKATTIAAGVFMLTSLTLAIMATRGAGSSGSVLERQKAPAKSQSTVPLQVPGGAPAPGQAAPGQAAPAQAPSQGTPNGQPSVTIIRPDGGRSTVPLPEGSLSKEPPKQQPAPKK
jgi:preprotein translocase subunit SecG